MAANPYILQTEYCCRAIERVLSKCDETDIKLVDLIYWKQGFTVTGAGVKVGLTKTPTYNRINDILCRIALEVGLVNIGFHRVFHNDGTK